VNVVVTIPLKEPFVSVEWADAYNSLIIPGKYSVLFRRGPLPIDKARNVLVEDALKEEPNYILLWDCDTIPPHPQSIYYLMEQAYPITSALYVDKATSRWCAFIQVGNDVRPLSDEVVGKLGFVDYVGMGFCLIEADVFRRLKEIGVYPPFRYEHDPILNPHGFSEDQMFCKLVREHLGLKVLLDGRVVCRHVWTAKLVEVGKVEHLVP